MLAEFSATGKPPIPRKFKWADGNGYEETIIVDNIVDINDVAIQYIEYDCISYFECSERRYILRFFREKNKWEIFEM